MGDDTGAPAEFCAHSETYPPSPPPFLAKLRYSPWAVRNLGKKRGRGGGRGQLDLLPLHLMTPDPKSSFCKNCTAFPSVLDLFLDCFL